MSAPNLAACQLATWTENAIKFKIKPSKKMEEKSKQKRGGYGVKNKLWEVLYLFFMILQYFSRFFENSHSCL